MTVMQSGITDIEPKEPDIVDRIRYVIRLSGKSQAKFARILGIDPANLSKILTGRHPVSGGFVNRLVADAGISKRWLLTGEGYPYEKEQDMLPCATFDGLPGRRKAGSTPLYDVDVTAGGVELSRIFASDNINGYVDIPGLNSGAVLVRVSGDSMTPLVPDGAYIAIRRVSLSSPIVWGHVYVVVTDDYRMVKRIRKNSNTGCVTLHSENPQYDDIDMPLDEIREIFIVEAVIDCRRL